MLIPLNDDGLLPAGIHAYSLTEVVEQFGKGSSVREVETKELIDFIESVQELAKRILVNGSYVTGKIEPNDVAVIVLPAMDKVAELADSIQQSNWPFLQVLVAADDEDFRLWAEEDFGSDREGRSKGVVEIVR